MCKKFIEVEMPVAYVMYGYCRHPKYPLDVRGYARYTPPLTAKKEEKIIAAFLERIKKDFCSESKWQYGGWKAKNARLQFPRDGVDELGSYSEEGAGGVCANLFIFDVPGVR